MSIEDFKIDTSELDFDIDYSQIDFEIDSSELDFEIDTEPLQCVCSNDENIQSIVQTLIDIDNSKTMSKSQRTELTKCIESLSSKYLK